MRNLRPMLLALCALTTGMPRLHAQSPVSNARAEIDIFNRSLEDATRSMSNAATLALWADGKPPFEGWGKMLLALHRGSDAKWRLQTEMWNQGVAPGAKIAPMSSRIRE